MSDAIEAAAKALISAQRDMFRGGGWFALDDAKTLVSAALTAYEAAKGGGVDCDLCKGSGLTNQGHNCSRCGGSGALTSPASEVEQIIAASTRMAKRLGVAFEADPAKVEQFIRGTSPASGERDAPAGYVLVPVEPTEEMMDAGWSAIFDTPPDGSHAVPIGAVWDAMLAKVKP